MHDHFDVKFQNSKIQIFKEDDRVFEQRTERVERKRRCDLANQATYLMAADWSVAGPFLINQVPA